MKLNTALALFALVATSLVVQGAVAEGLGRKMLNAPPKRLVNAQVNLDKQHYAASVTQTAARADAIHDVNKALYKQDGKVARADDRVESAAERAARLAAKAAATGSDRVAKKAAIAEVQVQKEVRDAARRIDDIADRTATKIDGALDRQARREDRAADKVDDAQIRLIKAQHAFDKWVDRRVGPAGAAAAPLPAAPAGLPFGGPGTKPAFAPVNGFAPLRGGEELVRAAPPAAAAPAAPAAPARASAIGNALSSFFG